MQIRYYITLAIVCVCYQVSSGQPVREITPNNFQGTDTERIQQAVEAARGTSNQIRVPAYNANGSAIWMIDSAILLPSNMKVILDNCTLQLSDRSRDNMFRSDNVGHGITDPVWNENISIIGVGSVVLKGAANPRATGDGARQLMLNPDQAKAEGNWRVSYGSDAEKEGVKQTGDWRNIMILLAYTNGVEITNLKIQESHSWSISFERCRNADINDISIENNEKIRVKDNWVATSNKDGINLRHGCKNFKIDNISGFTGDDFIALSSLDTNPDNRQNGELNSGMVTSRKYNGPEDDTENVYITNIKCSTRYRGIAIRASDSASIHHVYIDGLIARKREDRLMNAILLGGTGYGKPSLPGKINNIYAMNLMADGMKSMILIEAPVKDCHFSNGIYTGLSDNIITYDIDKTKVQNVTTSNLHSAKTDEDSSNQLRRPNVLIFVADDWSWPHASIYPESDDLIKTPNFDKIARNGALFTNAFAAAPSCSPSRAAILTGRYPHELKAGANLYGAFPNEVIAYPDLLFKEGYEVGYMGKGWGPGNFQVSGRDHNPAGIEYLNAESFFNNLSDNEPFCFWFGSSDPHRPYVEKQGLKEGKDSSKVAVPPYLPADPIVKVDVLDYYFEVQRFDKDVGKILKLVDEIGELDNTIVVVTSDNGWPFPRAKATLYDPGTRVPLAIMWEGNIPKGQVIDGFVNLIDIAPTFFEAAGIKPPVEMSGSSLLTGLKGDHTTKPKDRVFLERERHSITREGGVGYPSRAVRTKDFLYIRNFEPNRWPAGNPSKILKENDYHGADIDRSPTKKDIINAQRNLASFGKNYAYFNLVFDKRPAEELYDLRNDPNQLVNLVDDSDYKEEILKYRNILNNWMKDTNDPRSNGDGAKFDKYKYYGKRNR